MPFKRRKQAHISFLKNRYFHNKRLQEDYDFYGNVFKFELLQFFDCHKAALRREKYLIEAFNPYYNRKYSSNFRKKVIRSDGKIYQTLKEAAFDLGVLENTIVKSITDKEVFRMVRGYRFKYEDDERDFWDGKPVDDPLRGIIVPKGATKSFAVRITRRGKSLYRGQIRSLEEALLIKNSLLRS